MGKENNDTLNLGINEFMKKLEKSAKEHQGEKGSKEVISPEAKHYMKPEPVEETLFEQVQKLSVKEPAPVEDITTQLSAVLNIWWQSFFGDSHEKPFVFLEPKDGNFVATCLTKDNLQDILNVFKLVPGIDSSVMEKLSLLPPPPVKPNSQEALDAINQKVDQLESLVKDLIENIQVQESVTKIPLLVPELDIVKKLTLKKAKAKIEYYRIDGNLHKYKFAKGVLMHFGSSWSKDPEHKLAVWAINNSELANSVSVKLKGQKHLVLLSEVVETLIKAVVSVK